MLSTVHKAAAALATVTIATFWISTLISEVFLDHAAITAVKTTIPYGFFILIPAMAVAGATGFKLAKARKGGVLGKKSKRTPIVAANGILILIPAALFLATKAQAGSFDTPFYVVQILELIAGALNLTLLGLNIRDGRKLTAGKRRRAKA
ncbi:hypothetical protein [Shimia sagamensis]|uniref:Lipoprotein n=1 Tax=Shimia sagamensis TaxID=1566352 RepID=A0ABY1NW39_9RHOB|nr:hypothetical protein [Shimia sagamensis]SMP19983.1 hypothetical protein SAMN06265373_103472 [Shimia sagamensis]